MSGEGEGGVLDSTDAQRLSRLRILGAEARRRSRESSDPGVHLAVIAIDGVGELAIGLCMRRSGVTAKPEVPLGARLARLVSALKITPPGRKGFEDLHKMRNLVQHEGILPDREQIALWLAETEALVDALVRASFGVDLSGVGSAAGVREEKLRTLLGEAEEALEGGDPEASFQHSWQALEVARRRLRQATGLFLPNRPPGLPPGGAHGVGELAGQISSLAEQLEISAFTATPAEWLWLRQRQEERFRGLPLSSGEAARAFVFVLSCVLEFESYTELHNVDRWERWQAEQRAPRTDRPGGPHIDSVEIGDSPGAPGGRTQDLREWRFQLTDVPESRPGFDWAILAARDSLEDSPLTAAHLSPAGVLSVSCRRDLGEDDLWATVALLLAGAKETLARRALEDAEDRAVEGRILTRFRAGIAAAGCPCESVALRMGNEHRVVPGRAMVIVDFPESLAGNPSYLGAELGRLFPIHFPEHWAPERSPEPYDSAWNNVIVPASWDPRRVGAWAKEALAADQERRAAEDLAREAEQGEEAAALAAIEARVREGG
jgi:hypothetical protein